MSQFKLLLVASVVLTLGTACQKAANRTENGNPNQGQDANKPGPAEAVKSKTQCTITRAYTTVKDGVSSKSETVISLSVESIDREIDVKSSTSEYKTTSVQKWFSVAEDGTKTEKSTSTYIDLGKAESTFEKTEPNIYVYNEHFKGTTKTLNPDTQKYETEEFDTTMEEKYFNDGQIYYSISLKIDGKDGRAVVGKYRTTKTSEQNGRVTIRTRTLIEPVKDNDPNADRTMESSVRTCREEIVDSVDLTSP